AGRAVASTGLPAHISGATPLRIGRSLPDCCRDFPTIPSAFDDLRIYGRALLSSEVAALYQAAPHPALETRHGVLMTQPPPQPPSPCQLVHYCAPCVVGPNGQPAGRCPCAQGYRDFTGRPCTPK